MCPTKPSEIKNLLAAHGISVRKAWGQNFLCNPDILARIVAAACVNSGDTVLEVGPGLGALTSRLAERSGRVVAMEIDPLLCRYLRKRFANQDNLSIICGDILESDLHQLLPAEYKVVANLPYYITSPFLARLLEQGPQPQLAVILVQLEVARRLTALPGSKDYGSISVLVQHYTDPEIICRVAPGNFYPSPKVSSAVVRLNWLAIPRCHPRNSQLMFRLVRTAFSQRRKMLKGLVAQQFGLPVGDVEKLLIQLDIPADVRGEMLSVQEYCRLADGLEEMTL